LNNNQSNKNLILHHNDAVFSIFVFEGTILYFCQVYFSDCLINMILNEIDLKTIKFEAIDALYNLINQANSNFTY